MAALGAEREGARRSVIEPVEGRTVVLSERAWAHIRSEHVELARYEQAIVEAITHPDEHLPDVRPARERYFAAEKGPTRWLRVVVDFSADPGQVVTAFGHEEDPS